jgi:hypothetical protein
VPCLPTNPQCPLLCLSCLIRRDDLYAAHGRCLPLDLERIDLLSPAEEGYRLNLRMPKDLLVELEVGFLRVLMRVVEMAVVELQSPTFFVSQLEGNRKLD